MQLSLMRVFAQRSWYLHTWAAFEHSCVLVQILHLQGIRYLFRLHIFLYCLFGFVSLTALLLAFTKPKKWTRKTRDKALEEAYAA